MLEKATVSKLIDDIKKHIIKEIEKDNINEALELLCRCAQILYQTNICFYDDELENDIKEISCQIGLLTSIEKQKNVLLFYDGFGLNDRGLVQIYLKALCRLKRVVYVTYENYANRIPDVLKIVESNNGKVCYVRCLHNEFQQQICDLNTIILKEQPSDFFFYSTPNDVVGTVIMSLYEGILTRYQVNLTDHAFWLGAKSIDVCIEFRNHGASISNYYRKLNPKQIVKIPYYPEVHKDREFQGYPFELKNGQQIFFSGGSLYKTLGDNNKYYEIVDCILSTYPNIVFWYAGSGDDTELKKILRKYPDRAFHTAERADLFQVLRHIRFYLSTYPLAGGLMYQFAATAGRVPVTLKHDDMSDGILLNQEELGIQFENVCDLYHEVDKILSDECYFLKREKEMIKAVTNEDEFNRNIEWLLTGTKDNLPEIKYINFDLKQFREEYLNRLCIKDIDSILATGLSFKLALKYYPLQFFRVMLRRVKRKLHMIIGRSQQK